MTKDILRKVLKMYEKQCPLWIKNPHCWNEDAVSLLALSEHSKGFPFFTNIVDCYTRWQATRVLRGHEWSLAEWCRDTEYVRRKKNDERYVVFLKVRY